MSRVLPVFGSLAAEGEGLVAVRRGERYGYLDVQSGKMLVEPRFDWARPFEDGVGLVGFDGRRALIDREGRVVEIPELPNLDVGRPLAGTLFVFERDERSGSLI